MNQISLTAAQVKTIGKITQFEGELTLTRRFATADRIDHVAVVIANEGEITNEFTVDRSGNLQAGSTDWLALVAKEQ